MAKLAYAAYSKYANFEGSSPFSRTYIKYWEIRSDFSFQNYVKNLSAFDLEAKFDKFFSSSSGQTGIKERRNREQERNLQRNLCRL